MLTPIIALMVAGIVLIGLEMFVPGGVLGVFGGLCIIAGIVITFQEYGFAGALFYGALALVLAITVIIIEFKVLPKTKFGRGLFLKGVSGGKAGAMHDTAVPPEEADLIGEQGETATMLAPSGVVTVGGRQYEAFSEDGLLERGVRIEVIGRDNFRVIVRKPKSS